MAAVAEDSSNNIIYYDNDDEIDADETLASLVKTNSSSHLNSEAI